MMLSALTIEPEAISLPAPLAAGDAAPVVLTAQPLLRRRDDVATGLRNARYDVRYVATWDRLPEGVERIAADVVLVDMDAAGETTDGLRGLSGHRLIELLVRQLARQRWRRPVALVVITALDFAEIDYLVRAGIYALVHPRISPKALICEIQAALDCARSRHSRRSHRVAVADQPDGAPEGSDQAAAQSPLDGPASADLALGDAQWEEIAALLPPCPANARRRVSDRQVMEAALFLLRHGLPWSALPPRFGAASTIRRRLRLWREAGVFARLRAAGLHLHGPLAGVAWERLASRRGVRRAPARSTAAILRRSSYREVSQHPFPPPAWGKDTRLPGKACSRSPSTRAGRCPPARAAASALPSPPSATSPSADSMPCSDALPNGPFPLVTLALCILARHPRQLRVLSPAAPPSPQPAIPSPRKHLRRHTHPSPGMRPATPTSRRAHARHTSRIAHCYP